jgi:hypothetical protein
VHLEWQTANVGPGVRGAFFPFLIQDFTPRDERAFPQGKPSNREFRGIGKVVIAVKNLDEAIERYRRAYGGAAQRKEVDRDFGARLALMSSAPVVLAQPLAADSWLGKRLERFGEAPCAFLLAAGFSQRFHTTARARWFDNQIEWFDAAVLGWRLGLERSPEI